VTLGTYQRGNTTTKVTQQRIFTVGASKKRKKLKKIKGTEKKTIRDALPVRLFEFKRTKKNQNAKNTWFCRRPAEVTKR